MSGQGSSGASSGGGSSSGGGGASSSSGGTGMQTLAAAFQPMDCESSPRHSGASARRAYAASSSTSMASVDTGGALMQSSLGSYNSLILPNIPHLPAMMSSPMMQQPNFYNYGYPNAEPHMARQPSVAAAKQRDPEREDSPMVGVCVQQSPVAIH